MMLTNSLILFFLFLFFFNDTATTEIYTSSHTLSLHDALPISHSHLDHVAGLVYLSETLGFCENGAAVTITGIDHVVSTLRWGVFNNVLWPDFSKIPHADVPVVKYRTLVEDVEQRLGDLWVTPIQVNHTVPTTGFIIHDGSTGVIYSGDTAPTEALWRAARGLQGLRAVILECAFPNRLGPLAEIAKHLTPALLGRELDKMPVNLPVLIYHVKPQFHEEIAEELERVGSDRVAILDQDRTYAV